MHSLGVPDDGAGGFLEGAAPARDAPTVSLSPHLLAEIRLRLTGLVSPRLSIPVRAVTAPAAAQSGWLVVLDEEGVAVAAVRQPEPSGDHLVGDLVSYGSGTERAAGPFADVRRPLEPEQWRGGEVIVGHDPVDRLTLAAASPEVPLLVVVLDGPRRQPGPPSVEVIRSTRSLVARLSGERVRPVELRVLPAPQYGGDRDARLAAEIAAALDARLVAPSHPPDRAGLLAALDGGGPIPTEDWPPESMAAWRAWRPPRSRRGLVLFFTGLSGSGKSTIARAVVAAIQEDGARRVTSLDGDVVRRMLSSGLGFSPHDRDLNVQRIGFVAAEIARHGGIAVCAPIAPFSATRARVRAMTEEFGDFVLVHVATPLAVCERRDRKGLYARARAGEIPDFTGISSPYEAPDNADLTLDTSVMTEDAAAAAVVGMLRTGGWLPT